MPGWRSDALYPDVRIAKKSLRQRAALKSHIRNVHPEYEGGGAREVPIVEEDFTTVELARGKRMDIMRKASYGACDKLALRQLKVISTSFQRL